MPLPPRALRALLCLALLWIGQPVQAGTLTGCPDEAALPAALEVAREASQLPPRVALYGGSFNPVHAGHLCVAHSILEAGLADQVWFIPTGEHPFGKSLAPFADRVAVLEAATAGEPRFQVSRVEGERPGPSFMIDTVEILTRLHPGTRFSLVVGADLLPQFPQWRDWERLQEMVEVLPVRRAGVKTGEEEGVLPVACPEVSSTEVRLRIARGEPVEDLMPAASLEVLRQRGLYR